MLSLPIRLVCLLGLAGLAEAQITPLRDINLTGYPNPSARPFEFVQLGGWTYFVAVASPAGNEVYRTAGRPVLTQLVADIWPGPQGSNPRDLTVFAGRLFFRASDGATGPELWSSDGTPAGTALVLDLMPGASGSVPSGLTVMGNRLYFAAVHPTLGAELFLTDGTAAGTRMVKDISAGAGSSSPTELTVIGSTLWFQANDGTSGRELWKSDGTAAGTVRVADINPANQSPLPDSQPADFTGLGTDVLFTATIDGTAWGLWRTDGTTNGTVEVARFLRSPTRFRERTVGALMRFGTGLVLVGTTAAQGAELWMSDGTAAGTRILTDLNPGTASGAPTWLTELGGVLYFEATDGTARGRQLWRSDGTTRGTSPVAPNSPILSVWEMRSTGGRLFITAPARSVGHELWVSDGTAAGTVLVKDIRPGSDSSFPKNLTPIGSGRIAFAADDGVFGEEPWYSDGTAAGTQVGGDANPPAQGSPGSVPGDAFEHREQAFFSATSRAEGRELWRTDGTPLGTRLVVDVIPGNASSDPVPAAAVGADVLFTAREPGGGYGLWRTDGATAGRIRAFDARPEDFAQLPGLVVFTAVAQATRGIWATDGTAIGTRRILPLPGFYRELTFAVVDRTAYFTFIDGGFVLSLWRTDGTAQGTRQVSTIGRGLTQKTGLHAFGSRLLFQAAGELWISDGTSVGTSLLFDIDKNGDSFPSDFVTVGGDVFFIADDGTTGYELWKTDGTAAGTALVRDIHPGPSGSELGQMTNFDDRFLLFAAEDISLNSELWRSDGTTAGTFKVVEINPGRASSAPAGLVMAGSRFAYFFATHAASGRELWRSDGTAAGTSLVQDFRPGTASIAGNRPTPVLVDGRLLLTADSGTTGDEPAVAALGASWQPRGLPCGAVGRPTLRATDPVLGGTLRLSGAGAPAGTVGVLSVSLPPPAPLTIAGCELHLDPATLLVVDPGVAPAAGAWTRSYPLANVPVLVGARVVAQIGLGATPGPLGFDLSNGVRLVLGR